MNIFTFTFEGLNQTEKMNLCKHIYTDFRICKMAILVHSAHLSTKKDSLRLCVDYSKLNEKIAKDAYPIPRTEDNLEVVWILVDLFRGYGISSILIFM